MSLRCSFGLILLIGLAVGLPADSSQAALIQLDIFTDNGDFADDSRVDLYVEVTEDNGQVRFEFHNNSSVDSTIAEIYFGDENGLLLGIADNGIFYDGPGIVSFSGGGSPGHLPAGNDLSPAFPKPPDFMASADNPAPTNGINNDPDEWLAITFDVGGNSGDVADALADESLRIGVHVIGFSDGSSESAATAPEPATMGLMFLGSLMLLRRRRSHSALS